MAYKKRRDVPAKIHWKETPEWQKQVNSVLKLKARGFDESQMNALTQIPHMEIRRILEEEEMNLDIIKKQWVEKVPIMRDIIGMGLNGIKETLKEMADPDIRHQMIRGVPDLAALTKIVESLNMLLRLEEGKSTANVETKHTHTYQETRKVLQELQTMDPVFEYSVEEDG